MRKKKSIEHGTFHVTRMNHNAEVENGRKNLGIGREERSGKLSGADFDDRSSEPKAGKKLIIARG